MLSAAHASLAPYTMPCLPFSGVAVAPAEPLAADGAADRRGRGLHDCGVIGKSTYRSQRREDPRGHPCVTVSCSSSNATARCTQCMCFALCAPHGKWKASIPLQKGCQRLPQAIHSTNCTCQLAICATAAAARCRLSNTPGYSWLQQIPVCCFDLTLTAQAPQRQREVHVAVHQY